MKIKKHLLEISIKDPWLLVMEFKETIKHSGQVESKKE